MRGPSPCLLGVARKQQDSRHSGAPLQAANPESMTTGRCAWIPGCLASLGPRNDGAHFWTGMGKGRLAGSRFGKRVGILQLWLLQAMCRPIGPFALPLGADEWH